MKVDQALTEESWNEWLNLPQTKALRAWAQEKQQELKDLWASGQFSGSFTTEMVAKNAGATGACSAYAEIEEMDYKLIIGGREDGKS